MIDPVLEPDLTPRARRYPLELPVELGPLRGLTRDMVITLAGEQGIEVREEMISRGQLYTCDELFLTGTAAEITPIRTIDRYPVGKGCPGGITHGILSAFNKIITGETEDRHGWLTPVRTESREAGLAVETARTSA